MNCSRAVLPDTDFSQISNGEVFYQQIVQYMQETLGSQGVQILLNKMSDRKRKTEEADLKAKSGRDQEAPSTVMMQK